MPRNFSSCPIMAIDSVNRFNEAAADAAEFFPTKRHAKPGAASFNEAAADAAEFLFRLLHLSDRVSRFNEAAADAAEFSRWRIACCASGCCFNEAAADAAEFLCASYAEMDRASASMRPRQMPRNFLVRSLVEGVGPRLQ